MAGFGGTTKKGQKAGPSSAVIGAISEAAAPTATVERGSRAAEPSASRARSSELGSVTTTPSTSSGRAARIASWSAGSTDWAR